MRILSTLTLAALLSGCAHTQLARAQLQSPGQLLFNGYSNPKVDCHRCHDGDASGTWKAPSLEDVSDWSDQDIIAEINDGPGIMPSYRDTLSDAQKQQIVDWLRERFPADK